MPPHFGRRQLVTTSAHRNMRYCQSRDPELASPRLPLAPILGLRAAHRLPLEIGNRIGSAAGEPDDVIADVAGTGAYRPPVEGQGWSRWNSCATPRDRRLLAEAGLGNTIRRRSK